MLIMLQETPALRLHPDDDVAVALMPLGAGRQIDVAGQSVRLNSDITAGHTIALHQKALKSLESRAKRLAGCVG